MGFDAFEVVLEPTENSLLREKKNHFRITEEIKRQYSALREEKGGGADFGE